MGGLADITLCSAACAPRPKPTPQSPIRPVIICLFMMYYPCGLLDNGLLFAMPEEEGRGRPGAGTAPPAEKPPLYLARSPGGYRSTARQSIRLGTAAAQSGRWRRRKRNQAPGVRQMQGCRQV